MSIFGRSTPAPTRINAVQINQSVMGYALPVVMGRGRVQQSLLWVDGFKSQLINTHGGKGFGGGKDGSQYVYSADVIAALCAGEVIGVGDVWSGNSWLSTTPTTESWTITSGRVYTPQNVYYFATDLGVGISTAYSGTYNDVGADAPTALSGVHLVPFHRLPYGSTLGSGQYSVNPATNEYNFAAADIGKTIEIGYSFALAVVKRQNLAVIPSGRNVVIDGNIPFAADGGVRYYGGPNDGKPLTRVTGTPTVTGTYAVDYGSYTVTGSPGSYTVTTVRAANYSFAPGDVNAEVAITYQLNNGAALPAGTPASLDFSLFGGTLLQSPLALLTTSFPSAALGYSGIAHVAYTPMSLGYGAQIQQNTFEVVTNDGWGAGIADCNPVMCILRVLTDTIWGLGAGPVPFPTGAIDNTSEGTWGTVKASGSPIQDSTASSWFVANGFFISPVIDRQDTAAALIGRWLEAGQCATFMSEGLMKLVPYGDTSVAGNGAIWVAPSAYAAALDDSCFIAKKGQDPVKPSIAPWQDAYNAVTVTWNNRQNQYSPEPTPESDQAAINRYGSRIEDPQSYDFITTLPSAVFAASMRVKRSVYTRNNYEFSLPFRFTYLEPMDVVSITTSSLWAANKNNPLGIINMPVRIIKKTDNPDGTIDVVAEDYAFGVNNQTPYNKALAAGTVQPNLYADPGDTTPCFFEATDRLSAFRGYEIWMGATGANAAWGGCNVLVSSDGTTYAALAQINARARIGTLHSALPNTADPDSTDSLVVDLVADSAPLDAGTTADADADNTLTYVDGEFVSYSACRATGKDQYTADTYIRRGRMGTNPAAHSSGAQVMRLDNTLLKHTYDPAWAGKTIYFKFQSFNVFGKSAQDISTLTAYPFTITGNPGAFNGTTGVPTHPPTGGSTVETSTVNVGTSGVDTDGAGGWVSLMDPSFTITGTGDTVSVSAVLSFEAFSGSPTFGSTSLTIALVVDGDTTSPAATASIFYANAGRNSAGFTASVTGLAAGSHNFSIYAKDDASGVVTNFVDDSSATFTHIS